jgi:23S rRNA (uracil1939-C5)-methyltransferase
MDMDAKRITLTIEKLAGLGDGAGTYEGRKVFVPYTLAGDVVEATIVRRTTDADYATLACVLTPGADRVIPVCKHFGECGGCSLQHLSPAAYCTFKEDMARVAVRKAGYDPACVVPLRSFPVASRRRVELKAEAEKLGYFAERSHRLTDISSCPVLEPELEALVFRLKNYVATWKGLQSVQINGLDEGYDVLLTIEGATHAWPHKDDPAIRRVSTRYGSNTHTLHQAGAVTVTFGGVKVEPPAGAFLQAVRGAQEAITECVLQAASDAAHVLDMFAGLGTYSFPLAARAQVRAVEGDAAMVQAMREAAARRKVGEGFEVRRHDLFREPILAKELARYDAVVINPPRTGAAAQCKELAQTRIPTLVMISCNPATFARDARMLNDGGYALHRVTPIDQFSYSSHLELVAEFTHQ